MRRAADLSDVVSRSCVIAEAVADYAVDMVPPPDEQEDEYLVLLLHDIIENLRIFRPFIPESLFCDSYDDEFGEGDGDILEDNAAYIEGYDEDDDTIEDDDSLPLAERLFSGEGSVADGSMLAASL
eukprot:gene15226-22545_t